MNTGNPHTFFSKIAPVGRIGLPAFSGAQTYMKKHVIGRRVMLDEAPDFEAVVEAMISKVDLLAGCEVFLTIDQKNVKAGSSHRRGGAHVDGNFIFDWGTGGGGGWLTGVNGRVLSPENHALQYCNPNGGMLIVSDYQACRAWRGEFLGAPRQGGDCTHMGAQLDSNPSVMLQPDTVYLANSTCVHESLPVEIDVVRTLVRITLPPIYINISEGEML